MRHDDEQGRGFEQARGPSFEQQRDSVPGGCRDVTEAVRSSRKLVVTSLSNLFLKLHSMTAPPVRISLAHNSLVPYL